MTFFGQRLSKINHAGFEVINEIFLVKVMGENMRFELLGCVQTITLDVFDSLCPIWRSMFQFTSEFERKMEQKFIEAYKDFCAILVERENERRADMLCRIEDKIARLKYLKKELQDQTEEDVFCMAVSEPYSEFLKGIEDSIKKFTEIKDDRLLQLEFLRSKEKELCDLLELPPLPAFPNPIPYESQLDELESHILKLREEKDNRTEFFLESKQKIISLMRELEQEPRTDFEIEIISSHDGQFFLSTTKINLLKDLLNTIEDEYKQVLNFRNSLIEKLVKLWDRIKVELLERNKFLSHWNSIGKSHIKAIQEEIKRCEEIQLGNIKSIIEWMREQIRELWDLLTYTPDQRLQFKAFTSDHYSEEILDLHEHEMDRLQRFYNKNKNLYELVQKREALWGRMLHLDEVAMDKQRLFKNRRGQLLKEEKERKTLEVKVPQVNEQLKNALIRFKKEEGEPFLYHGVDLLEKVSREWEERLEIKARAKNARSPLTRRKDMQ